MRDLAKLQTDEISADLEYLANKHPEMFSGRPANVFKLIREIKENPTHFYANNRLDYGLIVKRLDGNKIGKLAVEKQTGDVKHATKVNDKDLKRLEKISKQKSGDAGIIQTFTQPGSKLENQGLGYQTTSIIPQSEAKVKELPPADLRKAIINAKDDKERLAIIENQKAGIKQRLENEAVGDKTADKLAKEAQGLADNKPTEKKFTLETIKSFDPRKHGHAYLSKISFNDRKPVREFIDSNTRMWDSKRKYYETSYTFNAKEGDMFEARLDDGSWKSDTKEYYIVKKKDDKGELYLSKVKELSDLQKEAIKEAEVKSEWESKISSSTDAIKLNKIMRDIKHTEAITPNNRAKLYVAITNRLKELRGASERGKVATKNAEKIAPKMSEPLKQLKGSEKQIAWANEIRDEFIEKAKDFKSEVFGSGEKAFKPPKYKVLLKGTDAAEKIYDDYINWILSHDEAKFWIDKRYLSKGGLEDSIRRLGTMTKSKDLLNFLEDDFLRAYPQYQAK